MKASKVAHQLYVNNVRIKVLLLNKLSNATSKTSRYIPKNLSDFKRIFLQIFLTLIYILFKERIVDRLCHVFRIAAQFKNLHPYF